MKVGFVGLGIMGRPMAKNLVKAGYELVVFDFNKAAVDDLVSCGAAAASCGKEVAEQCPVVITMVPNSPHVRAAVFGENGLAEGMKAGESVLIDMSSIDPVESKKIAAGTAHCDARTIKRSGWRNYWYGFVSTTTAAGLTRITDSAAANYNKVTDGTKTLTAGGAAISNKTLPTITAAAGDRMPVVVFPTAAKKKVASASMPGSLNAPVTFTKIGTVNLAGANGASAVSYDIWGYVADDMPVGADFSIVIGNQ
jgi:hypothetical protein